MLDRGRDLEYMAGELSDLIGAVEATGKAGTISFVFDVRPRLSDGEVDAVDIAIKDIKTAAPKQARAHTLLFIQPDGSLGRADPQQPELPNIAERREAAE